MVRTRLAVMLFTDIVSSTALKSVVGSGGYVRLLARHNELFERGLAEVEGARIIKATGDGYFAEFPTASTAVRFALVFQSRMGLEPWGEHRLETRVGIHAGEVALLDVAGRADVTGLTADLAARIMSLASGGQILMTAQAFNDARQFVSSSPEELAGTPPIRWVAHGRYVFKGNDEPLEVFEVGIEGFSPLAAPPDSEKARRAINVGEEPTLGWRPARGLEVPGRAGWLLERKLGEGGFGEVWLARRRNLGQERVFKFCFDADRLRSFKREVALFRLLREALGDRDDIARLYEVKLDEPPFHLESEFTPGGSLLDWAERNGGVAKLPPEDRLGLVAAVADAVAAAHSVGVLHKDLKPSNILVDERDGGLHPKLADFGIGAVVDRSLLKARNITAETATEGDDAMSRTGTRMYAPPESLEGKPFTTQGDVFALGVVLYQMAVGDLSRPLAPGWERDVPDELLRADIAACVDRDLDRRLSGARDLADRLRTLDARRRERDAASALEANRSRRRTTARLTLAGTAVAALALATGLGVTYRKNGQLAFERDRTAQALAEVRHQKAEVEKERAEAQAQRAEAEKQRDEARLATARGEQIKELLITALTAADPNRAGDASLRVSDAMMQAVARLDRGDLADQPAVEAELRTTVATILTGNAEPEAALVQARAAEALRRRLHTGDHPELAQSLSVTGTCLVALGRPEEGLPMFRQALEMTRRLSPTPGADVAAAVTNYASCLEDLGKLDEALAGFREALAIRQRLYPDGHPWTGSAMNNLAHCLDEMGKSEEALALFRQALEMKRRFLPESHPDIALGYNNLATSLSGLGRNEEAVPLAMKATELYLKAFDGPHPSVAACMANTATILAELGRNDEALPLHRDAMLMRQKLYRGDHPDIANSLHNLAACLDALGRHDEALDLYKQALEMRQRLYPADHPLIASTLGNLGATFAAMDKKDESLTYHVRALEMRKRLLGPEHPNVAVSLNNVGMALASQGRYGEAVSKLEEANKIAVRAWPADHPNRKQLAENLEEAKKAAKAGK